MKFGTKAIHAGIEPDPTTGAIMTPIYQTSTYVQKSPGQHMGFEYSRAHNPTRDALQKNLAALENAKHGLCFASGIASVDAIMKLLKPGDEVLSSNDLYGGTYRLFTQIYQEFGIKFKFIDMRDLNRISTHFTSKTRLVWAETPSNPMMNIIDIKGLAGVCQKFNSLFCVDNTFATPYLQNPLDLGADIIMHSVTKYLGGHSDVVMGALVTADESIAEQMYFIQNSSGAVCGPMDSFLVLRGLKTLHLRMEKHCSNGKAIALFLQNHPKVDGVFWPGFETHPNHEVAKKQMDGFGGMVSFSLKENTVEAATKVLSNTTVFTLAESLGGVESLLSHPASMTHAAIPKEEREKTGVTDSLIRFVGIEDADDLIADLKATLDY